MENDAELVQRARILKEAIDMELGLAAETHDSERNVASAAKVQRLQHMYGVVDYLLDEGDPENLGELVQKGRERIAGAKQLLEDYPNLRECTEDVNTGGDK